MEDGLDGIEAALADFRAGSDRGAGRVLRAGRCGCGSRTRRPCPPPLPVSQRGTFTAAAAGIARRWLRSFPRSYARRGQYHRQQGTAAQQCQRGRALLRPALWLAREADLRPPTGPGLGRHHLGRWCAADQQPCGRWRVGHRGAAVGWYASPRHPGRRRPGPTSRCCASSSTSCP